MGAAARTNIEILREAGLIGHRVEFAPKDADLINNLSRQEVEALISVRAKLGQHSDFLQRALAPAGPDGVPSVAIVF